MMQTILKKCLNRGLFNWLPDRAFLKLKYHAFLGKKLNLANPATFNEKIQWLKIHDRNERYTALVDKIEVKHAVAAQIGDKHMIPTLGIYDDFDQIDFASLPEQFVLKCSHDSGGLVICKDKKNLDMDKARETINACLKRNYYLKSREWPYKNVRPRIIAEKYIDALTDEGLADYKVFCFNGKPRLILVCTNRFSDKGLMEDFYDLEWNRIELKRPNHANGALQKKPEMLDEMLEKAEVLAKDIPFVRCDFYIADHKLLFGEMTFYPASGFVGFEPDEWDGILGQWLRLPE